RPHLAAQRQASQLHAVADAEDGNAQLEQPRVAGRGAGLVDAGRAAGEDEAPGAQGLDSLGGQVVADKLAKDVLLAHAPGDQLAVLGAEVEDENTFTFR